MFNLSKNGFGIAALLVLMFGYFDIDISVESLSDLIAAIGLFTSAALAVWNQITRQDTRFFFWKKE
jgi:hypothetical protein